MIAGTRTVAEVRVGASHADVWRSLREPALIARWFGWEYDGLDEEIEEIFLRQATADEAAGTLDWPGGDRIAVRDDAGGCVVQITRTAAAPPDGWDPLGEGWLTFAHALRFALERHPGEDRRSLYLSGALRVADASLAAAAGVASPAEEDVWMRSEHQLGILLGDALVLLTRRPGAPPQDTLTLIAHGIAPGPWADLAEPVRAAWSAGHDSGA